MAKLPGWVVSTKDQQNLIPIPTVNSVRNTVAEKKFLGTEINTAALIPCKSVKKSVSFSYFVAS